MAMVQALVVQPYPSAKRRRYAEVLTGQRGASQPREEAIKRRLREIRDYSAGHLNELSAELVARLAEDAEMDVVVAEDATQAAEAVRRICGSDRIAIGKSAVVLEEIVPALSDQYLQIIDSYHDQFDPFENRLSGRAKLPDLPLAAAMDSVDVAMELTGRRKTSLREQGAKDFTGLLGAAAVSARDGAIVLLQHTRNISDVVEQARDIIFVVALDKIVEDLDDAVFVAKAMAAFGWEGIPRNLCGKAGSGVSIDDLPFEACSELEGHKIHLILLDNGRSQLLQSDYRDLLTCIGCRACVRDCPTASLFNEGGPWTPKDYINSFVLGRTMSLEYCIQCKGCRIACPLDIDLPRMILDAKTRALQGKRLPLSDAFLAFYPGMAKLSSRVPSLANTTIGNHALRRIAEKTFGMSRERDLPRIGRTSLARRSGHNGRHS
jgi:L-lactate utilization protein LutB